MTLTVGQNLGTPIAARLLAEDECVRKLPQRLPADSRLTRIVFLCYSAHGWERLEHVLCLLGGSPEELL